MTAATLPLQLLLLTISGWVNRHQQDVIAYLVEENRVLKEQLRGRRLQLTDDQRRRLAAKAKRLARRALDAVATLVTPDTLMRWHRRLIAWKWTYAAKRVGRPGLRQAIAALIVRMARENERWGYCRIQGELKKVGHRVAASTIGKVLKAHGIRPAPERPTSWRTFLRSHWGTGAPRQLTDLEGGRVHVDWWSPDGRTLVVHQHVGGRSNVLLLSTDEADAEPQLFLEGEVGSVGAVFSPDGRYVAYMSTETGEREVYVRPYPGPGGQQTVSVGGGQQPIWAASDELFYRDLSGERMMAVSVATEPSLRVGTTEQLFAGNYYNTSPGGSPRPQYDVTADGQRFLMLEAQEAERPQINVVLNWHQELLERVPVP